MNRTTEFRERVSSAGASEPVGRRSRCPGPILLKAVDILRAIEACELRPALSSDDSALRICADHVQRFIALADHSSTSPTSSQYAQHLRAIASLLALRTQVARDSWKSRQAAALRKVRARDARRNFEYSNSRATSSVAQEEEKGRAGEDEEMVKEGRELVKRMAEGRTAYERLERQLESTAVLQEAILQKAVEQAEQCDGILTLADKADSELAQANEQLRKGIERAKKRGICDCHRLTVLSLVFMGLSLLFFNWLHP